MTNQIKLQVKPATRALEINLVLLKKTIQIRLLIIACCVLGMILLLLAYYVLEKRESSLGLELELTLSMISWALVLGYIIFSHSLSLADNINAKKFLKHQNKFIWIHKDKNKIVIHPIKDNAPPIEYDYLLKADVEQTDRGKIFGYGTIKIKAIQYTSKDAITHEVSIPFIEEPFKVVAAILEGETKPAEMTAKEEEEKKINKGEKE